MNSKLLIIAALALVASASMEDFPSFDFSHANCAMEVTYANKDCRNVYNDIKALLITYKNGCPSKGIYNIKEDAFATYIWATRTTPVKKYVDDVLFVFSQAASNACTVTSRSRSQSLSYYDFATNYCNMWNPLQHTSAISTLNVSECKFPADKPAEVCLIY